MHYLPLVALLSLTTVSAQEPFQAKQFLPNEYQNVVHVDLEQLRETGIWDELETGLLKVLLTELERESGFPLDALDRLTMIADSPAGDGKGGMGNRPQQVLIFEGNRELDIPDSIARNSSYSNDAVGDYDVKRHNHRDDLFLRPRPEIQIHGSSPMLTPILEGKPSAGLPCPDIMSLRAGRGAELLYFVLHAGNPTLNARIVKSLFPESEWPEGDGLDYLMVSLRAVGDPDDPNVEVEAVLRHRKAGDGLAVTEKAIDGWIAKAKKEPQLRLAAPLFAKIQRSKDRTDLKLEIDLGRARNAAGYIAMLALPLLAGGSAKPRPVQAAPAAPVPAPKKKGAPKK